MVTLFVSDLHLDATEPAASRQFLEFLSERAAYADALYILGDLFETWVGDDDDDPLRTRICDALRELVDSGVPCYVMRGNRDFLLQRRFETRTGVRLINDPLIVDLYGELALLTHGDALCTEDRAYQRLRVLVRRRRWQRRFMALPLAVRRELAEQARAGSRRHTRVAGEQIMDVEPGAVAAVMRACCVRTLIHGHTHRPGVHRLVIGGQNAQRMVLGAWHTEGSCISASPDGLRLEQLPRRADRSEIAAVRRSM